MEIIIDNIQGVCERCGKELGRAHLFLKGGDIEEVLCEDCYNAKVNPIKITVKRKEPGFFGTIIKLLFNIDDIYEVKRAENYYKKIITGSELKKLEKNGAKIHFAY